MDTAGYVSDKSVSSQEADFGDLSDCNLGRKKTASASASPAAAAATAAGISLPTPSPSPTTPTQRKRGRPRKQPLPGSSGNMITTGAFLTRTTLRKLGMSSGHMDLDSNTGGLTIGDCARVLSLDRSWYTAIILGVADGKALVHYPGWDHGFNEWIAVDSRRLLFSGKCVEGAEEQMRALETERGGVLDGFDLNAAVAAALGDAVDSGMDLEEEDGGSEDEPAAEADAPRARGRPLGRRNQRRVGRVKYRNRRAAKCPKPTEPVEEPTESDAAESDTMDTAEDSMRPDAETSELSQRAVPKELQIARLRRQHKISNPYARPGQARNTDSDAGSDRTSPSAAAKRPRTCPPSQHTAGSGVWDMLSNTGNYVTTGAFTTRRTIKCLAHNESIGGIIQDYHGFFPGQLVEVLNANRKWYTGRIITWEDNRFLVHYMGWGHAHNEWLALGSKRLRSLPDTDENEDDARRQCAMLVDEYNAHIDAAEAARVLEEKAAASRRRPRAKPVPVNARIAEIAGIAGTTETRRAPEAPEAHAGPAEDSGSEGIDESVEPIDVASGFVAVPQLLRVKDYVGYYRPGMRVAARDRNKVWWRAEIVAVKTFRLRIHYTGFPRAWDEWMEMNTQRVMLEEEREKGEDEGAEAERGSEKGAGVETERSTERSTEEMPAAGPPVKKRLGRPPKPSSIEPMSLRLALRTLAKNNAGSSATSHVPASAEVFELPREHMTLKDYGVFLRVGDKVQVRGHDKQWHECTIVDFKYGRIRVYFSGHSDEYNQWVAVNSDRIRVLRQTIEGDGRLERLEHEAQAPLRRRREKLREQRRRRKQLASASLVRLAETLEYVVGDSSSDADAADDDMPLVLRMLQGGSDAADAMPLATRLQLSSQLEKMQRPVHPADSDTWFVYCNRCSIVIRTFRYYCTVCEHPSDGLDYESFDLCLGCFSKSCEAAGHEHEHEHPRTAFARAPVCSIDGIVAFTGRMLSRCQDEADGRADAEAEEELGHIASLVSGVLSIYEPDTFDESYDTSRPPLAAGGCTEHQSLWNTLAAGLHGTTTQAAAVGRISGAISGRAAIASDSQPQCAFCGSADSAQAAALGGFAGNRPFVLTTMTAAGDTRHQRFWAHHACARGSPEVLMSPSSGQWFNVAAALRRGRTITCAACHKRGATVGCFHERCQRSYHVGCTDWLPESFGEGRLFWCAKHARDSGIEAEGQEALPSCAACDRSLTSDLMWMVCLECPTQPRPFSICLTCYETREALANHPHKKRCFREHLVHAGGVTSSGRYLSSAGRGRGRGGRGSRGGRRGVQSNCCHYCRSRTARRWRRGYGGVIMCEACFSAAHSLDQDAPGQSRLPAQDHPAQGLHAQDLPVQDLLADPAGSDAMEVVALNPFGSQTALLAEDYSQRIYFTRDSCVAPQRAESALTPQTPHSQQPLGRLASYGPTDSMLFTLIVDSTYFDIPGRAPRWGSHSGTDYHGTWLPQTVRRALLRHTRRGDRVLSNFLGRGTDAIESFLLSRKCFGVDINPSAVALSQRNCSFTIAPDSDMGVEFRPVIIQGDARSLGDAAWPGHEYFAADESFDHILSHPPYKDCVLYSTNIDGDLSRFPGPDEFQQEMQKVIEQSWRLLKMDRHLTLGIGDNRSECFYIPVSYQLIRSYIDCGFELDELIVKRQRYCQAFGLGTYLCVQFDFLMFTHEFIATLRKVPKEQVDRMHLPEAEYAEHPQLGFHCCELQQPQPQQQGAVVTVKARVLRQVPASPIERKSVVMGSVWSFERHSVHTFPQICMSRMVERFGRDGANWEQIDLALEALHPIVTTTGEEVARKDNSTQDIAPDQASSEADDLSGSDVEHPDNGTHAGAYERERQRQIQQNREQLLNLGLVSELGEDSNDTAHYRKLLSVAPNQAPQLPLALVVAPHVPNSQFVRAHVPAYRRALVQIAHDASHRLCPSGMLILGVQDVRDEMGKLWPLGMLVLEDVQNAIGPIRLRLKEFIVVVENGYARKRDDVISRDGFVDEKCVVGMNGPGIHVPIVHAYYLVFMKLK